MLRLDKQNLLTLKIEFRSGKKSCRTDLGSSFFENPEITSAKLDLHKLIIAVSLSVKSIGIRIIFFQPSDTDTLLQHMHTYKELRHSKRPERMVDAKF